MKADNYTIKCSIDNISEYLVKQLSSEYRISRNDALCKLLNTSTYAALVDRNTKMFCESQESVHDMLINELNGNISELLNR